MRNQDFIIATNKVNDASLSAFLIKTEKCIENLQV